MLIKVTKIISGFRILLKEIPADFMATNSDFSDSAPNVITEASSIDIGNANGTKRTEAKNNNSPI